MEVSQDPGEIRTSFNMASSGLLASFALLFPGSVISVSTLRHAMTDLARNRRENSLLAFCVARPTTWRPGARNEHCYFALNLFYLLARGFVARRGGPALCGPAAQAWAPRGEADASTHKMESLGSGRHDLSGDVGLAEAALRPGSAETRAELVLAGNVFQCKICCMMKLSEPSGRRELVG